MAKKEEKVQVETASAAAVEDKYSIRELARASRTVFGVESECVIAALVGEGEGNFSVSEAKSIIDRFLKKEVK